MIPTTTGGAAGAVDQVAGPEGPVQAVVRATGLAEVDLAEVDLAAEPVVVRAAVDAAEGRSGTSSQRSKPAPSYAVFLGLMKDYPPKPDPI